MDRLEYCTFSDGANRLGITVPRFRRLVEKLKIHTHFVGTVYLVPLSHLPAIRTALRQRLIKVGRPQKRADGISAGPKYAAKA